MNRKKPYVFKRVIAFVIDLFIVSMLSGVLALVFTNNKEYEEDSQKMVELTQKIASGEVTSKEFDGVFNEINYNLTLHSNGITIITVVVSIIYYCIMCYFCHGITLGKYIMKLKIESANGKDLNIFNYLIRGLIINSILSNIVTLILINTLSKEDYLNIYLKIGNIFPILMILSFVLMTYRNDGRGIHDLISNTKIVNIKDLEAETETNNVSDANIVKEIKDEGSDKDERIIRTRKSKKRKTK